MSAAEKLAEGPLKRARRRGFEFLPQDVFKIFGLLAILAA
jgi:hypothetical protein